MPGLDHNPLYAQDFIQGVWTKLMQSLPLGFSIQDISVIPYIAGW